MSDWNDLVRFTGAKMSTAITKYPSGRYGLVGSIPGELTKQGGSPMFPQRVSMVWDTEQEVMEALESIGVTRYQRADCSWMGI